MPLRKGRQNEEKGLGAVVAANGDEKVDRGRPDENAETQRQFDEFKEEGEEEVEAKERGILMIEERR